MRADANSREQRGGGEQVDRHVEKEMVQSSYLEADMHVQQRTRRVREPTAPKGTHRRPAEQAAEDTPNGFEETTDETPDGTEKATEGDAGRSEQKESKERSTRCEARRERRG